MIFQRAAHKPRTLPGHTLIPGERMLDLEAIIGTHVELIPAQDLKPAVRARVERDLVAL
jgi:predicted nucleotidyltransferase